VADTFIARQPIFDKRMKVYAYELLFRSGAENMFRANPLAAQSVIADATTVYGWENLLGTAKAFVNVDEKALLAEAPRLLDPKRVVLEILESVSQSESVLAACSELRIEGYELALDDFVGDGKWSSFFPFVKFLKVDFRACGEDAQREIAECYLPKGFSLLAEKVETREQVELAERLGYTFFQGFFFCKPTMISGRDFPANKLSCVQLLRETAGAEMNLGAVEELLRQDPSLTYKLLRYLNSPLLCRRSEVKEIRQALRLLGEREFRRWVAIVAVVALGMGKPAELARTAVMRGYFCDELAKDCGMSDVAAELFLMGLLSVADALLDRPMEKVLEELPLASEIQMALRGGENRFRGVYDLILAYEQGTWNAVSKAARRIGIPEANLPDRYMRAAERASVLA
jgi:c-di-GMP-related signal transduction protein